MGLLKSIAISGFKSFGAEVAVSLRPLNVLIGANGSGKSNFLDAFSFLRAYYRGQIDMLVKRSGGADKILHFGSRRTNRVRIRIDFGVNDRYRLSLIPVASDELGTVFDYPVFHGKFPPF